MEEVVGVGGVIARCLSEEVVCRAEDGVGDAQQLIQADTGRLTRVEEGVEEPHCILDGEDAERRDCIDECGVLEDVDVCDAGLVWSGWIKHSKSGWRGC